MKPKARLLSLRRIAGLPAELSDEVLVSACAEGEVAALGALFDRHHAVVYRFLSRLTTTDATDLDDLTQATFLEVSRSASQFSRRSAVRTWILGIAANVARHQARSVGRRRAFTAELASLPTATSAPIDEAVMRRQLMDRLAVAMEKLPHDLRVAFVMCDLEETPGVDAARALGVREGTLWRRLHDARKMLRAALGERS